VGMDGVLDAGGRVGVDGIFGVCGCVGTLCARLVRVTDNVGPAGEEMIGAGDNVEPVNVIGTIRAGDAVGPVDVTTVHISVVAHVPLILCVLESRLARHRHQ
jgi:hypothetical protein